MTAMYNHEIVLREYFAYFYIVFYSTFIFLSQSTRVDSAGQASILTGEVCLSLSLVICGRWSQCIEYMYTFIDQMRNVNILKLTSK